jgi:hypothetical protein
MSLLAEAPSKECHGKVRWKAVVKSAANHRWEQGGMRSNRKCDRKCDEEGRLETQPTIAHKYRILSMLPPSSDGLASIRHLFIPPPSPVFFPSHFAFFDQRTEWIRQAANRSPNGDPGENWPS